MNREDNIISLNPREFTRLKPNVYCGSTEYTTQLLIEVFSNAVDEFNTGVCKDIIVKYVRENGFIYIEDCGRGFPINELREDGKTTLEAAFSVLNTSGKYDEAGVYAGSSLGCYGIGSKLVNFLSKRCAVKSFRSGKCEKINFKDGLFENRDVYEVVDKNRHGTIVQYLPDPQFFNHIQIDEKVIKSLFKTISCICAGLTIYFEVYETDDHLDMCEGEFYKYYHPEGISQLVDEVIKSKIIKNNFVYAFEDGKNKADIVMNYQDSYSSTIVPYVNTGLTESGQHITQFKTIITREFNKFFKERKWLKEKESNLSGDEIQEGMYCVFNLTIPGVGYDAQIKSRITKIDTSIVYSELGEALQKWFAQNEKDIKKIFDRAVTARKAKEAAKKARDAVRKGPKEKGLRAKMAISNKFTDCVSKNPKERNLLLVEGASAAGSAIEARNVKTDCIYQLRGKTVSPLKCTIDKLLQNQEINDIIKIIGAGFANDFDVSKMNFDKVIITSDQDSDGFAIELLLITFFFTYMYPLVEAGKLYRAVTPLYIIKDSKGNNIEYFYSEEEMNNYRKNTKANSYSVIRAKGLGEVNSQVLKEVCFDIQRYKKITVSDYQKSKELLNILEGKDVEPRKQFVYDNAERLGFNI